jgi:formylglycine-generating enzyme required for sulfatase activity/energy-coupling factor transporter ATP-binding protein EcfA2
MPHSMQPDTRNATPEFPPDELLIFIGHSDDAMVEANAILELQSEIEKDFRLLRKTNGHRSPFHSIRLWEWTLDALAIPGGQEVAVTPAIDHAQIALFVFRGRVGTVTWQELEKARKGSGEAQPHVFAFFPESAPIHGKYPNLEAKCQAADNWAALMKYQKELTTSWTNPDAHSVTPCPTYQDTEELKTIVREKVRIAIADILAVDINRTTAAELTSNGEELRRYQGALKTELGTISLLGTHALENIPVTLTDTFVSLRISDTWRTDMRWSPKVSHELQREERIRNPEEVVTLVFETCRLLLVIGDPGSGKTTLLKHYALACLENEHYKTLGFKEPVLVFYLPLRELVKKGADYDTLPANLFAWSEKFSLGIAETAFFDWLHNRPTLLLLDGLDEIGEPEERIKACDWIDRVVTGFAKASVVVTSRYTGYRKGDGIELRSRHLRADIMDFSPDQQKEFLEKWFMSVLCRELHPAAKTLHEWREEQKQKAAGKAATIIAFLEREENQSLRLLAAVPMLLQIMAILWKDRHYLPKTRSELYNAAVNYILDYRDRQKEIFPLLSAEDARRVLMPVSLWMQEELEKDEADKTLMQKEMEKHLKTLHQPPSVEKFCNNLIDRAGLLVAYGDKEYRFRHKSFREYMAGLQLEKKMHISLGHLDKLVQNFGKDWWEEPLRFYIAEVDADAFDAFMEELFDAGVSATFNQKQQDLLVTLINEARQTKTEGLQKKLLDPATTTNRQRYIMQCLKAIGTTEALETVRKFLDAPFEKKAEALDFACEIAGVTELSGVVTNCVSCRSTASMVTDKLGAHYILIKGGTFTYSQTQKPETVGDMYVAKYTVTNRHYRRFIGYLNEKEPEFAERVPVETYRKSLQELASGIEEFSEWLKKEASLATRFCSSYDDDKQYNKDDQPVVGVTWYAAKACCLWLSLLESESRDVNLYRLPTEKEWEYAAAGEEGRRYPWGNEGLSPTRANYNNNEGSTTPTGRYPEGATPEGLHDMAGNVWEWTEDLYQKDKDWRAVRGGAYYSGKADALRCSSRIIVSPRSGVLSDVGFRVIRSSHFSLPENLIL